MPTLEDALAKPETEGWGTRASFLVWKWLRDNPQILGEWRKLAEGMENLGHSPGAFVELLETSLRAQCRPAHGDKLAQQLLDSQLDLVDWFGVAEAVKTYWKEPPTQAATAKLAHFTN